MEEAYKTSMIIFDQVSKRITPTLYEQLRSIEKGEIVVIPGAHDHIEKVLDTMQVPYEMKSADEIENLNGQRVVFANCTTYHHQKHGKMAREYVNGGGRLITTDWALSLMTMAFPGMLRKTAHTEDVVVEIQCPTDIARNWIGMNYAQCSPQWWLESSSYVYSIKKDAGIIPIITSEEMKQKYGQPYVTVGFKHGEGEAFHFISHLELQRTKGNASGTLDDFLEKVGAEKTDDMDDDTLANLEAAYSALSTLANLCIPTPILDTSGKSIMFAKSVGAKSKPLG
jgi:hypothetical protein